MLATVIALQVWLPIEAPLPPPTAPIASLDTQQEAAGRASVFAAAIRLWTSGSMRKEATTLTLI